MQWYYLQTRYNNGDLQECKQSTHTARVLFSIQAMKQLVNPVLLRNSNTDRTQKNVYINSYYIVATTNGDIITNCQLTKAHLSQF